MVAPLGRQGLLPSRAWKIPLREMIDVLRIDSLASRHGRPSTGFIFSDQRFDCSELRHVSTCSSLNLLAELPSNGLFSCSGHQRVTKRDPKINPLVIEKAGALAKGEIWHLDDSPRLYHQGNPFKYDASWTPLTSTVEEFQAYVDTLPKPEVEVLAGPFQKAKDDAKIANNNKKPKAKGKGKGKGDDPSSDESEDEVTKKERATRKVLEVDLPLVLEAQEVCCCFSFL